MLFKKQNSDKKIGKIKRKTYAGYRKSPEDIKNLLKNQKVRKSKNKFKKNLKVSQAVKNLNQESLLKGPFIKQGGFLIVICFLYLIASIFYSFYLMNQPAKKLIFIQDRPKHPVKIISPAQNDSILDVDSFSFTLALNNQPWVLSAKLKTYPPQVLGYFVKTRTPKFILTLGQKEFLVDEHKVLLSPKLKDEYDNLPRLILKGISLKNLELGASLDSFLISRGMAWLDALAKSDILPLSKVSKIDISDPYSFIISTTNPDLSVKVNSEQITQQLERLAMAMPALALQPKLNLIDVRVKDRVIFK